MKRKSDFIARTVVDQELLVPVGSRLVDMNAIVVLNHTGRFLWNMLSEERTLDDLATAVADRFDVDPDRARDDVGAFLDDIARMGLLDT